MNARLQCLGFLLATVLCSGPARAADTNVSREYREAVATHEKALAAATATENKHHQDVLNGLIRRAQAEGDTDTIARLKADLETLPVQPQSPAAPVVRAGLKPDFLGQWHFRIARSGGSVKFVMDIRADGTWSYDRSYSGTWTVAGDYLNVRFNDDPKGLDRYSLPASNGELRGKNLGGETLILSRKAPESTGGSSSPDYFGKRQ